MLVGCKSTTQEVNGSTDTSGAVVETPEKEEIVVIIKRPVIEVPLIEEKISTKPIVEEESKPSNWYIGLVAEDPGKGLKTHSAQLGILEEGNAVVKHTLISSGRFAGSYLDIVFVDPDGVAEGVYKTNYHTYQEGIEEHWRFTVKTDDVNAEIFLSWRGLYLLTPYTDDKNRELYKEIRSLSNPLIKYMKLVDIDAGVEKATIVNGEVQTYVFNMNGKKERVFEWVVQNEIVSLPPQTNKLFTRRGKSIQRDISIEEKTAVEQRAESFDLSKPPIFQEDNDGK